MMIEVKDLGIMLLLLALTILIIYLIVLTKNSIETVKRTNKILEDTEQITEIASKRAQEVDGIVADVAATVGAVTTAFKGKEGVLKSFSTIAASITALLNLIKKQNTKSE